MTKKTDLLIILHTVIWKLGFGYTNLRQENVLIVIRLNSDREIVHIHLSLNFGSHYTSFILYKFYLCKHGYNRTVLYTFSQTLKVCIKPTNIYQ